MEEGPKIQQVVETEKLQKILECPVCQDIPFPPIHTCAEGHIVCRSCRPRLSACALCRGSFGGGRNFPLEEIILATSFSCKFKGYGCKKVILGSDFKSHVKTCEANPFFVLCNNKLGKECTNAKIRSNIYVEHLEERHELPTSDWEHNRPSYTFYQVDEAASLGYNINTDYFEHESESFIQKWEMKDNLFYTWICMLNVAHPSQLKNYIAKVTVYPNHDPRTKFQGKLRLQDPCAELEEVKRTGSFLAFLPFQLKSAQTTILENRIWDYAWHIEVSLLPNSGED